MLPRLHYVRCVPSLSPLGSDSHCLVLSIEFNDDSSGFRMSDDFVQYVLDHAICSRCLNRVRDAEHLYACKDMGSFIEGDRVDAFKKLLEREQRRLRQFRRKEALNQAPLPVMETLSYLREKQWDRCYYCFGNFDDVAAPHLDHFVSVANGGTNSLFNLVYSCPTCNREKCAMNGNEFIEKYFPTRRFPTKTRLEVVAMREAVNEWKETYCPRLLSKAQFQLNEENQNLRERIGKDFDEGCSRVYKLMVRIRQIEVERKLKSRTHKKKRGLSK